MSDKLYLNEKSVAFHVLVHWQLSATARQRTLLNFCQESCQLVITALVQQISIEASHRIEIIIIFTTHHKQLSQQLTKSIL